MSKADFTKWQDTQQTAAAALVVPYLSLTEEDTPIDFLFQIAGKGMIAKGNISCIKGREKTGKSAAGLCLIAAALSGKFGTVGACHEALKVLWIDTEQDQNTLRQKAKAVLQMADLQAMPEGLHIVPLLPYTFEERAALLQLAVEECSPDLLFLDGVVDLCSNFMEGEASQKAVAILQTICAKFGCAVITIIHTNKKDDEARGHLGTFMQQKSGEVYTVERYGTNATMQQAFSRFAPAPPFSFSFLDNFMLAPILPADIAEQRKVELTGLFQVLFAGNSLTYTQLLKAFKTVHQEPTSERAINDLIKEAVAYDVLYKEKKGRCSFYSFLFPQTEDDEEFL